MSMKRLKRGLSPVAGWPDKIGEEDDMSVVDIVTERSFCCKFWMEFIIVKAMYS
jgi:hypothetical protein